MRKFDDNKSGIGGWFALLSISTAIVILIYLIIANLVVTTQVIEGSQWGFPMLCDLCDLCDACDLCDPCDSCESCKGADYLTGGEINEHNNLKNPM